jgi:hypothetical protein
MDEYSTRKSAGKRNQENKKYQKSHPKKEEKGRGKEEIIESDEEGEIDISIPEEDFKPMQPPERITDPQGLVIIDGSYLEGGGQILRNTGLYQGKGSAELISQLHLHHFSKSRLK